MEQRRIDYLPLDEVKPAARNPRRHDLDGVRASISRFGYATPALRDERTGRLVAGHGRTLALAAMRDAGEDPPAGVRVDSSGAWLVPVVCGWQSHSDAEADAYLVADNRWTEKAGWDDDGLAALLASIGEVDPGLVAAAGFDDDELAALLAEPDVTELEPVLPPTDGTYEPPADPVTKPGDIWLLGPHRVICGDCRDFSTVERLLDGREVNVAFTSPPYASQRKYDESSGFRPIPPDEYVDWFEDVQANVRAVLASDGSWFVNIKEHCDDGQRHLYVKDLTIAHVRRWGWRFVDELCWVDTMNGVPGGWPNRFKDAWEPVFHYSAAGGIKFNAVANASQSEKVIAYDPDRPRAATGSGLLSWQPGALQEGLARPSNVIQMPAKTERGIEHSAMFPIDLPRWFIRAYSDEGDAVFDPFMGSGTTLMAAHSEGRVGYGSEISPAYTDIICRRFQEHTGVAPILEATDKPHDFTGGT